jgi:hypothetical protein
VTNAKIQKSEAKNRNCTHKPKIREQKFEQHDQGARIACVHRKTQYKSQQPKYVVTTLYKSQQPKYVVTTLYKSQQPKCVETNTGTKV